MYTIETPNNQDLMLQLSGKKKKKEWLGIPKALFSSLIISNEGWLMLNHATC
jgi:hypothetical protein